jgi:hypothetical protein
MSPLHFIRTAAEAGCRNVALWPEQTRYNPRELPYFSLIDRFARPVSVISIAQRWLSPECGAFSKPPVREQKT